MSSGFIRRYIRHYTHNGQGHPVTCQCRHKGEVEVRLYSFFNLGAMGMGCQRHAPASLLWERVPVPIVLEAGWAPRSAWTGMARYNLLPHRELNRGSSSPWRVVTSTTLVRLPLRTPDHYLICSRNSCSLKAICFQSGIEN